MSKVSLMTDNLTILYFARLYYTYIHSVLLFKTGCYYKKKSNAVLAVYMYVCKFHYSTQIVNRLVIMARLHNFYEMYMFSGHIY